MSEAQFDFFVIGGGSGGVRAARLAAQAGVRVGLAESNAFGGTCVNVGCIPKKLFSYASQFPQEAKNSEGYGWSYSGDISFDIRQFIANKDREIARLNGIYESLLTDSGVEIFKSHASFMGPHILSVGGQEISAKHILIATGGVPSLPSLSGIELANISDDLFSLPSLPKRVVVVGGGYIAVEFAGILHGLGCDVVQIYRGGRLLRGFDEDVGDFLASEMLKKGVDIKFGDNVKSLRRGSGDEITCELESGGELSVDRVFFATGRGANVSGLGLESAGISCDKRGFVEVDDDYCTSADCVYGVGDVIGRVALTPVALREGTILVERLFGSPNGLAIDYDLIATAIFSHPPIGSVGLSEVAVRERGLSYDIYASEFTPLRHTVSGSGERSYVKMLVERGSDKVLGVHMVDESAPEIMQGFAVAMSLGATKRDFDSVIGIHPTSAEELVTLRTPIDKGE